LQTSLKKQARLINDRTQEAEVLMQVKDNQRKLLQQVFFDRNIPHIKGEMGYPPHFVKSSEQEKLERAAISNLNRKVYTS
jgi:hypothetical protein